MTKKKPKIKKDNLRKFMWLSGDIELHIQSEQKSKKTIVK